MIRWFDNLKIQAKFIGPVVTLLLVGLFTISVIIFNISVVAAMAVEVLREQNKVTHVQAGLIALLNQELIEKNFLITGDHALTAVHTVHNDEARRHFETALAYIEGDNDRVAIQKMLADMHVYHDTYMQMVSLYEAGDRESATRLTLTVSDPALAQTHHEVEEMIAIGKARTEQSRAETFYRRRLATIISLTAIGIFLLNGLAIVYLARRMTTPVLALTTAAAAVEAEQYDLIVLEPVSRRQDELGSLARVFQRMVREVYRREQELKQQVVELRIEIDTVKRAQEVEQITGTEYFQELQRKAREMRQQDAE
jgi:nitrogen fixation/metabolism regulation signal transduction histidine kinase